MIDLLKIHKKIRQSRLIRAVENFTNRLKPILYKIPIIKHILLRCAKCDEAWQRMLTEVILPKANRFINSFSPSNIKLGLRNWLNPSVFPSGVHSNQLTPDAIELMLHQKRSATIWKRLCLLIILFFGATFVISIMGSSNTKKEPGHQDSRGYIANILIEGAIHTDYELYESLAKIRDNKSIKAVILRINSPGGAVQPSERIYKLIAEIDAVKPVFISMEAVAASGGYLIATAGRYIFAMNSTITGSIGVYAQSFDITELLTKLGIKSNQIKTSPIKGAPNPFEPMSPEVEKMERRLLENMHAMFKKFVMIGRKLTDQQVDAVSNGAIFTGYQAMQLGLVDCMGDEQNAISELKKQYPELEKLPVKHVSLKEEHHSRGFGRIEASIKSTLLNLIYSANSKAYLSKLL